MSKEKKKKPKTKEVKKPKIDYTVLNPVLPREEEGSKTIKPVSCERWDV